MSSKTHRMLIVDDEDVILEVLEEAFSTEPYDIVTVASGAEAIRLLDEGPFDLLITDKNLPLVDGVEVSRHARACHPNIGVIVITGYASQKSAEALLRLGIDDYIVKPFDLDVLLDKARRIRDYRTSLARRAHDRTRSASTTQEILLAEADRKDRARIARALEMLGYAPVLCEDVLQALRAHHNARGIVLNRGLCTGEVRDYLRDLRLDNPDFVLVVVLPEGSLNGTISSILLGARAQLVQPFESDAYVETVLRQVL